MRTLRCILVALIAVVLVAAVRARDDEVDEDEDLQLSELASGATHQTLSRFLHTRPMSDQLYFCLRTPP